MLNDNLKHVFDSAFEGVDIWDTHLEGLEGMASNVLQVVREALEDKETVSNFVSEGAILNLMGYALRNAFLMGVSKGSAK